MKHFDASPFPDGPCHDCFDSNGRMVRWCKGGDGGASAMAQASMQQSASIAADNMRNLRQQQRMAANAPTQDPLQPASPPQQANPDTAAAALNQKRQALKRFGFNATVSQPLGGSSTLGGAA